MANDKQSVAYILAASHSGSTLLALMMDSHPDICSVGELKVGVLGDLDNYLCSCRRKIVECPFWTDVKNHMHDAGESFEFSDPGTDIRVTNSSVLKRVLRPMVQGPVLEFVRDAVLLALPAWHRHWRGIRRRNRAFLGALGKLSGASVVADSSKVGIRLKYLLRDKSIDVRVVRLIRDGRGVALTYINPSDFADAKASNLRGGGTGNQNSHAALAMPSAAQEWVRANEEAEELKKRVGADRVLEIHYEDLCGDTITTLNMVYEFLGVAPLAADVIRDVDNIEHHIVGNGMRLDDDHTIVLDERWKTQLSETQLTEFENVAGAMNSSYGYR